MKEEQDTYPFLPAPRGQLPFWPEPVIHVPVGQAGVQGELRFAIEGADLVVFGSDSGRVVLEGGADLLRSGHALTLRRSDQDGALIELTWEMVVAQLPSSMVQDSNPYEYAYEAPWVDGLWPLDPVTYDEIEIHESEAVPADPGPPRMEFSEPSLADEELPPLPDTAQWTLEFVGGPIPEDVAWGHHVGDLYGQWIDNAESISLLGTAQSLFRVDHSGRVFVRQGAVFDADDQFAPLEVRVESLGQAVELSRLLDILPVIELDQDASGAYMEYAAGADQADIVMVLHYERDVQIDPAMIGPHVVAHRELEDGTQELLNLVYDTTRTDESPGGNSLFFSATLSAAEITETGRIVFDNEILDVDGERATLVRAGTALEAGVLPDFDPVWPGELDPDSAFVRYSVSAEGTPLRLVLDGENAVELVDGGDAGEGDWGGDPAGLRVGDWVDLRAMTSGEAVEVDLANHRYWFNGDPATITDIVRFDGVLLGPGSDVVNLTEAPGSQVVAVERVDIGADEIRGFDFSAGGDLLDFSGLLAREGDAASLEEVVAVTSTTVDGDSALRFDLVSADGATGELVVVSDGTDAPGADLDQLVSDGLILTEGLY